MRGGQGERLLYILTCHGLIGHGDIMEVSEYMTLVLDKIYPSS